MTRWSARFRLLTPPDTIDTIDTNPPRGLSDPFVSIVSIVSKGGIGRNERGAASAVPPPETDLAPEHAPMAPAEAHAAAVRALQRVALPFPGSLLAGIPGAFACAICQRGIWCSPSWPGPPPAICRQCELGGRP
jgi:hypothetical protein